MALVTCRECGQGISTDSAACPHCGKPTKAKGMGGCSMAFVILGGLMLFVMLLGWLVAAVGPAIFGVPRTSGAKPASVGTVSPAAPDPRVTAIANVKLAFTWYTEAYGSIMFANFTVSNDSDYTIKDIEV